MLKRSLALLVCLCSFRSVPAAAQYMYLDANGDGVNSTADVMNPIGMPTIVDVYLKTNQNRDGSVAMCNTSDGELSMFSYIVNLKATGGTVSFANFVNQQPTFTVEARAFDADSTQMTAGQATTELVNPGSYRLCTVTITGQTGSPSVTPIPLTTLGAEPCSFGTQCSGNDLDNTYDLGGDWLDADGIAPSSDPPSISAPSSVATAEGASITVEALATSADMRMYR